MIDRQTVRSQGLYRPLVSPTQEVTSRSQVWRTSPPPPPPPPVPIIMQICLSCFHKIIYNGCDRPLSTTKIVVLGFVPFLVHRLAFSLSSKPGIKILGLLGFSFSSEAAEKLVFSTKNRWKMKTSLRIGEVWELKADSGWLSKWKVPVDEAVGVHNERSS